MAARTYPYNGKEYTIAQLEVLTSIAASTLTRKLNKEGKTVEEVVATTKPRRTSRKKRTKKSVTTKKKEEQKETLKTEPVLEPIENEQVLEPIENEQDKTEVENIDIDVETNKEAVEVLPKEIKVKPSRKRRPIRYNTESTQDLINLLRDILTESKHINLIDFENAVDKINLDEYINDENAINVFFYNSCIYGNIFSKTIKNSPSMNIEVITYEAEKQLIDHILVYYLGALHITFPDVQYQIISKDSGFYPFVNFLYADNIKARGLNFHDDKDDRYKYCLFKYIINDNILKHRRCIVRREFFTIFEKFFKGKVDDKKVNDLINKLSEDYEVLNVVHKKGLNYYEFDMETINNFVRE